MKKIGLFLAALALSASAFAQTLKVNQGSVSYVIPASQMNDAVVSGTTITIGKKSYKTNEISSITVEAQSGMKDNTVNVYYGAAAANKVALVEIAGNIAHLVDAKVEGGHVTLLQKPEVTEEITYTLRGASDNGSFYFDGKYKATVVLDGLSLANADSAAINIQNGKRINVVLKDGTASTLSDGLRGTDNGSDAHKACFYVNGHTEFSGSGSLVINGNVKHGFVSDEYCQVKAGTGAITVAKAASDGFHIGQYFLLEGGAISITAKGDGVDVGKKKDPSTENNGKTMLRGGSLTVVTDGAATKALKSDGQIEISGGTIKLTAKGDALYDAAAVSDEDDGLSSAAAIKTDESFAMTGGTVTLLATGRGGKLLNATGLVSISGGKFSGAACGDIYSYSAYVTSKSHGIKSDSDIVVSGGEVYIAASEDDGKAFNTDMMFAIKGGTLMGIGGKKSTPGAESTQGYRTYKDQVVRSGATVTLDGVSFAVPAEYSNTAAKVVVSKAGM